MFDYEYIKNCYKLVAIDLSRQKELDTDPKAIQEIEFVGQLKDYDGVNVDGAKSTFVLTSLKKSKKQGQSFHKDM